VLLGPGPRHLVETETARHGFHAFGHHNSAPLSAGEYRQVIIYTLQQDVELLCFLRQY